MIKDIINSLLSPSEDNNYMEKINEIIFPVKCYLCSLIFLLVLLVILNILIIIKK